MSNSGDSFKTGSALIIFGCSLFYKGLKNLKICRKIQDIPTSKIASASVGSFVEIKGKVFSDNCSIESPLSRKKGVVFIWDIFELVRQGKNSRWKKVHTYYSTPFLYLYDNDKNDLAALDLTSCDFQENIVCHVKRFDETCSDLPEAVTKTLVDEKVLQVKEKSFLLGTDYQIKERVFQSEDNLYVLGTAISPPAIEKPLKMAAGQSFGIYNHEIRTKINTNLLEARQNKEIAKLYDLNGDNIIDRKENVRLQNHISEIVVNEHGFGSFRNCSKDTRICFTESSNNEKYFNIKNVLVSSHSEGTLSLKLQLTAILMIIGGPILVFAGFFVLFSSDR